MRGSGKKRASLRRVWTRREAHIRPFCRQPIPRCNDNSCPSVCQRPCAGIYLPTEASLKPVGVPERKTWPTTDVQSGSRCYPGVGHQRSDCMSRFTHSLRCLQVYNSYRDFKAKVISFILINNRQLQINHVFVWTQHKKHAHSHQKRKTLWGLSGGKKSFNHPNFIRTWKSQMIRPFNSPSMCAHKQNSCHGQKKHQDYRGNKVSST